MSAGDILVTVLLLLTVGAVVLKLALDKKRGKGHCTSSCGSCPQKENCNYSKK